MTMCHNYQNSMPKTKVALRLEQGLVQRVDELVAEKRSATEARRSKRRWRKNSSESLVRAWPWNAASSILSKKEPWRNQVAVGRDTWPEY